jgi:hypothetical protein
MNVDGFNGIVDIGWVGEYPILIPYKYNDGRISPDIMEQLRNIV